VFVVNLQSMSRVRHGLNAKWWNITLGEWIALVLAFIGIVVVFCLFFIRRQVLEYRLDHTFTVHDPEFIGSALALANPVPLPGNKITLLENGDEYFPAMLSAICSARTTIRGV